MYSAVKLWITQEPQCTDIRHDRCGPALAQAALEDLDDSLRIKPGDALALGTRADAKRMLGDHAVSFLEKLRQIHSVQLYGHHRCPMQDAGQLLLWAAPA